MFKLEILLKIVTFFYAADLFFYTIGTIFHNDDESNCSPVRVTESNHWNKAKKFHHPEKISPTLLKILKFLITPKQ